MAGVPIEPLVPFVPPFKRTLVDGLVENSQNVKMNKVAQAVQGFHLGLLPAGSHELTAMHELTATRRSLRRGGMDAPLAGRALRGNPPRVAAFRVRRRFGVGVGGGVSCFCQPCRKGIFVTKRVWRD